MAAGDEIVRLSIAVGGGLSGEHGIGLEKRDFMGEVFDAGEPRRPGAAARRLRSRRLDEPWQDPASRLALFRLRLPEVAEAV